MPRHLVVGNGKFLINLDQYGCIRDMFYPYVGQLNHVGGYRCHIGCYVDEQFSWLSDPEWKFQLSYLEDSLVTQVTATHDRLGITLRMNDGIHQRDSIYLKRMKMTNHKHTDREIRIFFHQDLVINETEVGDTAVYYPYNHTIFHYKKDRYFMFNALCGQEGIYQFSTGVKRFHQAEGTFRDAEDGHLMGNPIAQGSVDSVISIRGTLPAQAELDVYYWLSAGQSLEDVKKLDYYVKESGPGNLLDRVTIYWQRWANKTHRNYADLHEGIAKLFKHSLLIVRTQTDVNGAIIAANDTDIMQFNRDHYSYMWPRDGALVADAMSLAGYHGMIEPFFHFCARALAPEGYLHHKYNPDGTVGSSWHPYVHDGKQQYPIQEDETALVLFTLWQDYVRNGDIELPQSLYRTLIRRSANFLSEFIEPELQLPKPSYDLWEERYGIFTFTTAAVYGGLSAAANFAKLFGDDKRAVKYQQAAEAIKISMEKHLWNEELGRYVRGLYRRDGQWVQDATPESSIFGLFEFGVFPPDDERVVRTMQELRKQLTIRTSVGGIARYYHDYYFQKSSDLERIPGNPWIICTLWFAKYDIATAKSLEDLETPRRTLEWVVDRSMESGMLSEQVDPISGSPLSVAPLTWSHATFVSAVLEYTHKYHELSKLQF
ncbi:glycoside hydrolase family 15 [Paenibacillus selenitireducens]|uniref:Glycoside hydrolase family 15 n=1 Tax=Paenibacillus selenitireducens TaxID=1324314 RepID=A0A1T2XAA0_9BACL|nr:glycoside hydrolase family 15 protein [Paenibacillus selenitireducens]OPA76821.1 glycoside hydrolase family 15 [Paenibacillus selenitireducens]